MNLLSDMRMSMELSGRVEPRAAEIKMSREELAGRIDHTLLAPYTGSRVFRQLCDEARTYHFHAVCVNPYWIRYYSRELRRTGVGAAAVVGFPLGQTTSRMKALEAQEATENGASEVDMVMNIGALKDRDYGAFREDIAGVVGSVLGNPVKVILEVGYLTYEEVVKACEVSKEA
jgi:deoxyribose-phosphate aldolase